MKSDCYFEECKDCMYKECSHFLMCCLTSRLRLALHRLFLEVLIVNKFTSKNEHCHWYLKE